MRVLSSIVSIPAVVISYDLATSSTIRVVDVDAVKFRAGRGTDGPQPKISLGFLQSLLTSQPMYAQLPVDSMNDTEGSISSELRELGEPSVQGKPAKSKSPGIVTDTRVPGKGNIHRLEYSDGSVYEGQVRDGQRHGRGTFKQFGEKYLEKGMWQKDVAKSYEGMWQKDVRHGQGVLKIFFSGHTVKGTWDNGQLNGNGSETKVCKLKYGFGSTTLPRDIMPEVKGGYLLSGYSVKIEGVCEEKPSLASEKPNTGILVKNGTLTYGTGVSNRDRVTVKLTADLQLLDAGWDLKLNV